MREEFEASYLRGDFYAAEQDSEVRFQDFRKHCAYVAFKTGWQASRAAIQLEFPQSPYMPDSDPDSMSGYEIGEAQGRCDMWEQCRESVKSLGLKVTP